MFIAPKYSHEMSLKTAEYKRQLIFMDSMSISGLITRKRELLIVIYSYTIIPVVGDKGKCWALILSAMEKSNS